MPTVHSKPVRSSLQDDVILHFLIEIYPQVQLLKNFRKGASRYSYEAGLCQQNFYDGIRGVVSSEKANALARLMFKGAYPKSKQLRWFCDYYQALFNRIQMV